MEKRGNRSGKSGGKEIEAGRRGATFQASLSWEGRFAVQQGGEKKGGGILLFLRGKGVQNGKYRRKKATL